MTPSPPTRGLLREHSTYRPPNSVARPIVDRRVLHLIKMWLECPVEETDQRGRLTRTTQARDSRRGIPQGSPRFVLGWKKVGLEQSQSRSQTERSRRQQRVCTAG